RLPAVAPQPAPPAMKEMDAARLRQQAAAHALPIVTKFRGAAVAPVPIGFESLQNHGVEVARPERLLARRRRPQRVLFIDSSRVEGQFPGQGPVHRRPDAVQIRAFVDIAAPGGLLWTHIAWCADRRLLVNSSVLLLELCETEVREPKMVVRVDEDVRRLDVAVQDL